jgi:hypothetical protein
MPKEDARRARDVQGKAAARLADAQLVIRKEVEAAATRIADQLGGSRAGMTGELGFLDDVVNLWNEAGEAVERVIVQAVHDLTELLDDYAIVWDYAGLLGESGALDQRVAGEAKPDGASAERLLAAREALLERRDRGRRRITEIAEAIRGEGKGTE